MSLGAKERRTSPTRQQDYTDLRSMAPRTAGTYLLSRILRDAVEIRRRVIDVCCVPVKPVVNGRVQSPETDPSPLLPSYRRGIKQYSRLFSVPRGTATATTRTQSSPPCMHDVC